MQVRTHLNSSSVSLRNIATLFEFFFSSNTEAPIAQIRNLLQTIIKRRNTEPAILARQALQDLQTIIDHATNLGVTVIFFKCFMLSNFTGIYFLEFNKNQPGIDI